jgi:hypothetical protein
VFFKKKCENAELSGNHDMQIAKGMKKY